ncbi:MAG: DUF697 domain-containing protein [Myxococcota bacterium]
MGTEEDRERRLKTLIERCGYGAAALTIIPIPGSEIIGVVPLHVGMVMGIGSEYGQQISREAATDLIKQIGATVGLSLVGTTLAMTAGKIILPGLGGLVAAPFMFASTLAIGAVAKAYFRNNGNLTTETIKQEYEREVERAKGIFDPAKARSSEARAQAEAAVAEERGEGPSAAAAPPPQEGNFAERLTQLRELLDQGLIDEAEYEKTKARILDSI